MQKSFLFIRKDPQRIPQITDQTHFSLFSVTLLKNLCTEGYTSFLKAWMLLPTLVYIYIYDLLNVGKFLSFHLFADDTKVWQEIKCYFCTLAHILSNIESTLTKYFVQKNSRNSMKAIFFKFQRFFRGF